MIYVEMLGRMGNQMFSYAHARYIQLKGKNEPIAIDFTNFENIDETWINYLQFFKCKDNVEVAKRDMNFMQKMLLKLFYHTRKKKKERNEWILIEKKWAKILQKFGIYIYTMGYYPYVYKTFCKNKLLIGFFESPKYFKEIKNILQKDFSIDDAENNLVLNEWTKKINVENAICIGIRKWGLLSHLDLNDYDVCTPEYYREAVNKIKNLCGKKQMTLYIFTEDAEWVRSHYKFEDEVYYVTSSVSGNIKPWEAMNIMTYFKYYVISNSTFHWWGQFLSKYNNRVTVAPKNWRGINPELYRDIYEDDWILVDILKETTDENK